MVKFKANSKKGSINQVASVLQNQPSEASTQYLITNTDLSKKNLFNSDIQNTDTRMILSPIMMKNQRILYFENKRHELENLKRLSTDVKKTIKFLYSIQFPIRLLKKLTRRFNYSKVIKLYDIFNKKKNTKNFLSFTGTLEPTSKQMLINKLNSFLNENKHSSLFSKTKTNLNEALHHKNQHNQDNNNFLGDSPIIQGLDQVPLSKVDKVGIFALPKKSDNNTNLSLPNQKNLNKDQNNNVASYNTLNNKPVFFGTIKFVIESLSKFNADIANNQFLLYNYNKSNKFTSYPFEKVIKLLTMSFLTMGCFISKPTIQIVYKSYAPQLDNSQNLLFTQNKKMTLSIPKISNIVNTWSNKNVSSVSANGDLSARNNFNKKVYIQLFYYVRSENPMITFLSKLTSNYNHIRRLMTKIFISEATSKKSVLQEKDHVHQGTQLNNIENKYYEMIEYLTEMKTIIRNEQKSMLKKNILRKYTNNFKYLGHRLSTLFNAEVELELIRLYKPYYNSHILVQNLSVESYVNRFVKLVSNLFYRIPSNRKLSVTKIGNQSDHYDKLTSSTSSDLSEESYHLIQILEEIKYLSVREKGKELETKNNYSLPSYFSGVSVKLGGRTFKQRIIPRMTQKRIQKGSLNRSKVVFLDRARFTGKTKKGAYSFTVKMGHLF